MKKEIFEQYKKKSGTLIPFSLKKNIPFETIAPPLTLLDHLQLFRRHGPLCGLCVVVGGGGGGGGWGAQFKFKAVCVVASAPCHGDAVITRTTRTCTVTRPELALWPIVLLCRYEVADSSGQDDD